MKRIKKRGGGRSLKDRIAAATRGVVRGMSDLAGAVHPLSGPATVGAKPERAGSGPRTERQPKSAVKRKRFRRRPGRPSPDGPR